MEDVRASLYKNILLMGGNAMFNGFKERVYLIKYLNQLLNYLTL